MSVLVALHLPQHLTPDFLNFIHSSGIKHQLIVVLNCISLITNDAGHIFMSLLLAICISSFVKYLLKSFVHFYKTSFLYDVFYQIQVKRTLSSP